MKILHFLTSKAGKLVIGAPQMLTIAGVGLMATYGAFKTDQILDRILLSEPCLPFPRLLRTKV